MDVKAYIDFIDAILENAHFSDASLHSFRDKYNRIIDRYNDSTLYLSMLSSFSAGKSTLINSLLGQKLLKAANEATTAVPTFINSSKTDSVRISVKLRNGNVFHLDNPNEAEELSALLKVAIPQKIEDIIELFTTDVLLKLGENTIHDNVSEVYVDVPNLKDAENICIIDTPGINAGGFDSAHHIGATIETLNANTDAALVLFPAHQAYTQGFEEFLDKNAAAFLEDSIYVLSMMDLVEENEHKEVIEYVRQNLKSHFLLTDPTILHCAAGKVRTSKKWATQFSKFKKVLYSILKKNREQILCK